jgi:hypothetical protein
MNGYGVIEHSNNDLLEPFLMDFTARALYMKYVNDRTTEALPPYEIRAMTNDYGRSWGLAVVNGEELIVKIELTWGRNES